MYYFLFAYFVYFPDTVFAVYRHSSVLRSLASAELSTHSQLSVLCASSVWHRQGSQKTVHLTNTVTSKAGLQQCWIHATTSQVINCRMTRGITSSGDEKRTALKDQCISKQHQGATPLCLRAGARKFEHLIKQLSKCTTYFPVYIFQFSGRVGLNILKFNMPIF